MTHHAADLLPTTRRVVLKVGSSLLVAEDKLDTVWLAKLMADVAALRARDLDVVIVSSGAVALGRAHLDLTGAMKLEEKQAAAAAGQAALIRAYEQAAPDGALKVAQLLLTADVTDNRRTYLNARSTLETLLDLGALPIVNENDTVATAELRYGDNDRLAAHVAQMAGADMLVLLSDVAGLYTSDPARHEGAELMSFVEHITPEIAALASPLSSSGLGAGGMVTKIDAARIATAAGCNTVIASGKGSATPLAALLSEAPHTLFAARGTPRSARAQWISSRLSPRGRIMVDHGAATALADGASLLPVGATSIEGEFKKGDAVEVFGPDGNLLARGLVAYPALEAKRIKGLKTQELPGALGYEGRACLIHRDDMVLMEKV